MGFPWALWDKESRSGFQKLTVLTLDSIHVLGRNWGDCRVDHPVHRLRSCLCVQEYGCAGW